MLPVSDTDPTEFFVYGTLRPDSNGWAERGYTADPVPGTAKGVLYNYGYAFPYADFDGDGTIVGDIITVDPAMAKQISRVETGAGYELREVLVTTKDGPRVVLGWQITARTRKRTVLSEIPSGDWLQCVKEETARYARR